MSQDVSSDWLFGINGIAHRTTWVSHDLIGDENCHVELLTDFLNLRQKAAHDLLPFRQLASTGVVYSEGVHDGINDKQ